MAESEVRNQAKLVSSLLLAGSAHLLLLSIFPDNTMNRRLASFVIASFKNCDEQLSGWHFGTLVSFYQ